MSSNSSEIEKYREFGLSLLPNVDKSKMIGVRLPQLRAVAATE